MKKIHALYISCLMMTVASALFTSCSDDEVSAPVITNVRLTDPATRDVSLSRAFLGHTLVIQGSNLGQVTKLFINDYEVKLLPTYVTNTDIVVTIVDQVPTEATHPNVPSTLRVETKNGLSAVYDFETLPPPPIVELVSNEMANAGETITLTGRYLYLVNEVAFPGGVPGTNISSAADGTWLKVTVPPGVDPAGGHIFVTTKSGTSVIGRRTLFGNRTGLFINFDDINPFGWGIQSSNITTSTPGGIIKPIDNKFAMVNATLNNSWGWSNDKVIDIANDSQEIYPVGPGYDSATTLANLDLRMEVAVEKPTNNLDGILLTVYIQLKSGEYSYNLPLGTAVKSLDGTWYTVSVPLTSLEDAAKKKVATYRDILAQEKHDIRLVINNSSANDINGTIAIDNVRIVNHTR